MPLCEKLSIPAWYPLLGFSLFRVLIVLQIILFRVEINLQFHDFKGETPTHGRNTFKMSKKNNNFFYIDFEE